MDVSEGLTNVIYAVSIQLKVHITYGNTERNMGVQWQKNKYVSSDERVKEIIKEIQTFGYSHYTFDGGHNSRNIF